MSHTAIQFLNIFKTTYKKTSMTASLAIGTLACITACGGSGSGGGESYAIPKADFTACDQHPEVGSSALIGNASKTEFIKSDYFNKPYDRYDLEAVLDASVASTIQYVNSLGINLKKIVTGSPGGKCPNYFSVLNAPENLLAIWNEAAGGSSNNASLQGIFFENCGREGSGASCKEREMINPTILVNHVADRWTLVHELMHFNFNQGRKASTDIPSARRLEQMEKYHEARFKKFYSDFKAMPNRGDLSSAISELETLVLATHHSLAQGPLEEVAIEAMLIKLWSQDQLKNVGGRTPSTWYLKDNAKKVMTLNQFEDVISTLKKDAETNFWPEIADQADKALDRMLAPRTEALRIAEEAEAQIAKKTGSPSPVVGQLPPISAPPDTGAGEPAPAGSTTGGTKTPAVEEQVVSESGIRSNAGIKWSDHESHQGCGRNYNLQTLEASARSIHDFVLGKK